MQQWLPRGLAVSHGRRLARMVAAGESWQIYTTNTDAYVLAVTACLCDEWIQLYSLSGEIFVPYDADMRYRIFCGAEHYLISSLDQGPFPQNAGQVEAFSAAFGKATERFPDTKWGDALYLEEYSLILPGAQESNISTDRVYGKWLTGGVNISVDSFSRLSQLMSWLPADRLADSVHTAGFLTKPCAGQGALPAQSPAAQASGAKEAMIPPDRCPPEKFVLTGRPELERFFNDNIIDIVRHQEEYKRMGISFPGATILYGPPGCGKTFAVDRLCEYLGWPRFDIDSFSIASTYIHETSKKTAEVFQAAIQAAPSIVVIDEMEAFLSDRSMSGPSGIHHMEEVAEFLREIPKAVASGVLIFAMTNMIESIDPAIRRRGRFDHIVEVKMASKEEIESLIKARLKELPAAEDIDTGEIANKLDGHPLSDVAFILQQAGKLAVKEGSDCIDQACLDQALLMLPKEQKKRTLGF